MKVQQSLQRLGKVLPIKNALDSLDKTIADCYFQVLHGFYQQGRAPLISELEQTDPNAREHIALLAAKDMLTVDETGEVQGCYPFTLQKRVHRVQLNGFEVHAMCALDALAPSSMFECPSIVLSQCAVSGEAVRISLDNQQIRNIEEAYELHVGINWMAASSFGSCADTLCTEMLFFKDTSTAHNWLNEDPGNRETYDLAGAIEISACFFKPMLQQS